MIVLGKCHFPAVNAHFMPQEKKNLKNHMKEIENKKIENKRENIIIKLNKCISVLSSDYKKAIYIDGKSSLKENKRHWRN